MPKTVPDWAFINGKARPIRYTPGYEEGFVGLSKLEKDHLRALSSEDGKTYAHTADRKERKQRAQAAKETPSRARLAPRVQEIQAVRLDAPRHHPKIW